MALADDGRHRQTEKLLDKGDQRVADDMGEGAGAGGRKAQHLKPVCQGAGMAALAAVFDIVVDRVIVGGDRLERREIGLGDGPARDVEVLADREVLEIPALGKAVGAPVEILDHLLSQSSEQAGQITSAMKDPNDNRRITICGIDNQIRIPG